MFGILKACLGGSSNGRTAAFEAVNLGSIPSPPENYGSTATVNFIQEQPEKS